MTAEAERMEGENDVVVIDTAGARNQAVLYAIGVADLVPIPVQLSSANVIEAVNTYRTVESASKLMKRDVPGSVVFTGSAPKTNIAKHIKKEVKSVGLKAMKTRLNRLVAFQELSYGEVPRTGIAGGQAQVLLNEIRKMGVLPFMDGGITVTLLEENKAEVDRCESLPTISRTRKNQVLVLSAVRSRSKSSHPFDQPEGGQSAYTIGRELPDPGRPFGANSAQKLD